MAGDELVQNLLLLHGVHPVDMQTRVLGALEKTRPYLRSHGERRARRRGRRRTVRLRMQGSCHGCPSSALTLKLAIEKAIQEAAPDVTAIVVEDEQRPRETGPPLLVELGRVAVPLAPGPTGPA